MHCSRRYYGRVNRERQNEMAIRALVEQFEGRWDEVNQLLEKKYGVSPRL